MSKINFKIQLKNEATEKVEALSAHENKLTDYLNTVITIYRRDISTKTKFGYYVNPNSKIQLNKRHCSGSDIKSGAYSAWWNCTRVKAFLKSSLANKHIENSKDASLFHLFHFTSRNLSPQNIRGITLK